MKRHTDTADVVRVTVFERFDNRPAANAMRDERPSRLCAQIGGRSGSQVIAVRVRNHRAVHRHPGIDVKAAGPAVQARVSRFN
jgi:hypothetical protein